MRDELRRHRKQATSDEIERKSATLLKMIRAWRKQQRLLMPETIDMLNDTPDGDLDPEMCTSIDLSLPSDLATDEDSRSTIVEKTTHLAKIEAGLREADIWEAMEQLRKIERMLGAEINLKTVHIRNLKDNTRANSQVHRLMHRRSVYLDIYNRSRLALLTLDCLLGSAAAEKFPQLSVDDTKRKPVEDRRMIGSSRTIGGRIWSGSRLIPSSLGGSSLNQHDEELRDQSSEGPVSEGFDPNQLMTRRKSKGIGQ